MLNSGSLTSTESEKPENHGQSLVVSATVLDEALYKPSSDELALLRETLSSDEGLIKKHVLDIQKDEAFPYPCIRLFTFISFLMASRPVYMDVVRAGQAAEGTVFLDVGCNMGTDVRKLVFDGYPAKNVYACDLHEQFLEIGHKLYSDKGSCEITFFPADVFSFPSIPPADPAGSPTSKLETFRNRVTHLYNGLFFHLFGQQGQNEVAKRLAALLDRRPGSIIFGMHVGSATAGPVSTPSSQIPWAHSPESFTSLWKKVFVDLEGEIFVEEHLQIEVVLVMESQIYKGSGGVQYLDWSVRII